MASVEDIKAILYDLCGIVRMITARFKAKVALTHGPENVKPQVKLTYESGSFCFEVNIAYLPWLLLLSVPGLMFLPSYVDVMVCNPLLNVKFSQALVNIFGTVAFKENCGPSVSVTLVRLADKYNEERKAVTLTDESREFIFPEVFPGKYRLEVKHNSPQAVPKHNWCWEQRFVDVVVDAGDLKGIVFVQKGYRVNVISTHDVNGYITRWLTCEFEDQERIPALKIDTSNPPVRGLLGGQINVQSSSHKDIYELPENIFVDILNAGGSVSNTAAATVNSHGKDLEGGIVYEFSLWANLGEEFAFFPRDSRLILCCVAGITGRRRFLFYPREYHVSVTDDNCQATVPSFSGRPGICIEGSVSPPTSGVHIRILSAGDSSITPRKRGELLLETTTGMDGSFVAGPLYDDIACSVEASKLSQISVYVYSKDDAKEPIPSVLLSLSGDNGYRNNSISEAGGEFLFDNLFPGTSYLCPVLKEYAFFPSSQALELGSGESKEIILQATRVAYSATGIVTLLSGQPKGVSVEARAESKGYYEETVTDSSGSYHLRGLLPDATFVIKVVKRDGLASASIERASPESVAIKPEMTIISCHVEGKRIHELHPQLMVEIKSARDKTKLRSSLPSSNLKFESDTIEVDLEKNSQIHVGPLRYRFEEDQHKQDLTPAPVFSLFVGVSAIALFLSMPRLKDLYQATVDISTLRINSTSKKDVRRPIFQKKTY
ncbi:Carbohydrate-binding-like fold [Quillaja saponaria]|uniref:Carbohydrate-binding-like fold n=1 Tax=Quillaja saponaria TaxID=32244 RepID=A0AAD7Q1D7_QUISA|nr:Carbohydrate-binding-like fold [Quillaja saponaria]